MEGHNAQPAPNAQKLNYNCPHLELNKLVFVMTRADQTVNYEMFALCRVQYQQLKHYNNI